MPGGEKAISHVGPYGGVGVPDAGRTGRVRGDERENQSPELLDAAGVGGHHRDAGQERGVHHKRFLGQNAGGRDQQDPGELRQLVELRLDQRAACLHPSTKMQH